MKILNFSLLDERLTKKNVKKAFKSFNISQDDDSVKVILEELFLDSIPARSPIDYSLGNPVTVKPIVSPKFIEARTSPRDIEYSTKVFEDLMAKAAEQKEWNRIRLERKREAIKKRKADKIARDSYMKQMEEYRKAMKEPFLDPIEKFPHHMREKQKRDRAVRRGIEASRQIEKSRRDMGFYKTHQDYMMEQFDLLLKHLDKKMKNEGFHIKYESLESLYRNAPGAGELPFFMTPEDFINHLGPYMLNDSKSTLLNAKENYIHQE